MGVIAVLISADINPGLLPLERVDCLEDSFFIWTDTINKYFSTNLHVRYTLMILFGLMSDTLLITQLFKWSAKGRTWRFPIALLMIYALKLIFMVLFYSQIYLIRTK